MLSSSYLETTVGKTLPLGLRNQYRIEENDMLSDLLLSPRAVHKDGSFMACESCHPNIAFSDSKVPPKFAISNGWCIGEVPNDIIDGEISENLESSVVWTRILQMYLHTMQGHIKQLKDIMFFS